MVNEKRVRQLKAGQQVDGPVIYWMSRNQRVNDNWALAYALESAENNGQHAAVVFVLANSITGGMWRQTDFMLKGLIKIEKKLRDLNIPFFVLNGEPAQVLPQFLKEHHASLLVADFDPMRASRQYQDEVLQQITLPADEVDAYNIVPCWIASDKEEYGAYTIRPKIRKQLHEFMDEFPPMVRQRKDLSLVRNNWEALERASITDRSVPPVDWISPGEEAACAVMERFFANGLRSYASKRNDPNDDAVSGLSPYIRFGHISSQRIAIEILNRYPQIRDAEVFLEELIIRRELSDNLCYYNSDFDRIEGFRKWARMTLERHIDDPRSFLYTRDQFEEATTHDELWNAAQYQMVCTGKMHGYMRMYWAKKILEWSRDPEEAYSTALYLNDRYELDGQSPNGYAGCAWSIGGTHDRPWFERQVFGKIRYMNRAGCERKFNVPHYISRFRRSGKTGRNRT